MHKSRMRLCAALHNLSINKELPSPECYPAKTSIPENPVEPDEPTESDRDQPSDTAPQTADDLSDDEEAEDETSPLLNDLVEPTDANHAGADNDEQEIRVSVDGNGNLIPTGSQLADYLQRGEELNCHFRQTLL
ncbi:hypothetical protein B0H14DRAFT_2584435 [Mycena olivaceomarginata]|nr:hypothetical protein B0H14DRAFT_2584435 [Mycena olivaceomarginata]